MNIIWKYGPSYVCVCVPILAYIVEWMYICRCPGCGQLTAIPSTLGGKNISTTTDSSSSPQGNPCGFTKKHFSIAKLFLFLLTSSLSSFSHVFMNRLTVSFFLSAVFFAFQILSTSCQLFPFACQLLSSTSQLLSKSCQLFTFACQLSATPFAMSCFCCL